MTRIEKIPSAPVVSRRSFVIGTAASGIVLGYVSLSGSASFAQGAAKFEPSVWYSIGIDGKVTVVSGKAEMGQHVASTMAQLIAEELEADWKDLKIVFPTNDPKYNDPLLGAQITGGSWSTRFNFDAMCRAGAAGRITLIKAGAAMMNVPESECTARNSQVMHRSGKKLTYGQIVAGGKAIKTWTPDALKGITLKTKDQYRLIGQAVAQLDIPPKANGTAKFGIDSFVPAMLYGALALPPVRYGATVKSVDETDARKVKGFVKAVTLEDKTATTTGWVVAVASDYTAAKMAAAALKITYDKGPNANVSDQTILNEARRLQKDPDAGLPFVQAGDAAGAMGNAAKVLEAEYTTSINIHAPLEPMNALAEAKGGLWHIYTGNQFATRTGGIAAAALGVDPKTVVMHNSFLGGGFGRRLDADMVIPAVLAAKAVGKPVKVIYTREDDMAVDFTRPLTYQKVKAGLDQSGKLVALLHDVVCAWPTARWGIPDFLTPSVDKKGSLDGFAVNGADFWYTVPNHSVRAVLNELAQKATPSGQLRSVAPGWTFWAVESMIDEVAAAAGKDPVEFRLAMLDGAAANAVGAKRLANALRTAVGRTGYGVQPLPRNHGIGVACVSSQDRASATWTACAAEVEVEPTGKFKLNKLSIAMDVGTAVNPDGVRAQIEGSAMWGVSIALFEQAHIKDGALQVANFDTYTPLRMSQMPELDISIIANGGAPSGCGEPAVTVVAPAIANAIFNAVGARVRSLPITAEAVKAAMKT